MKIPPLLRRYMERASRYVSLRRRLPARFGGAVLHVSPAAALCYFRRLDGPAWREVYDFAEHGVPRCAVVWDIGASMGVFSFAAAHIAGIGGRVLAVEADTWSVGYIKNSVANQPAGAAPVNVLCAAVSGNVGVQLFDIPERSRAGAHLKGQDGAGEDLLGGTREAHPVVAVTLDWLLDHYGAPATVKIDIEGAELDALRGARRVLAEARPALMLEVFERNSDAVTEILLQHQYRLFDAARGWTNREPIGRACYNTLALPS